MTLEVDDAEALDCCSQASPQLSPSDPAHASAQAYTSSLSNAGVSTGEPLPLVCRPSQARAAAQGHEQQRRPGGRDAAPAAGHDRRIAAAAAPLQAAALAASSAHDGNHDADLSWHAGPSSHDSAPASSFAAWVTWSSAAREPPGPTPAPALPPRPALLSINLSIPSAAAAPSAQAGSSSASPELHATACGDTGSDSGSAPAFSSAKPAPAATADTRGPKLTVRVEPLRVTAHLACLSRLGQAYDSLTAPGSLQELLVRSMCELPDHRAALLARCQSLGFALPRVGLRLELAEVTLVLQGARDGDGPLVNASRSSSSSGGVGVASGSASRASGAGPTRDALRGSPDAFASGHGGGGLRGATGQDASSVAAAAPAAADGAPSGDAGSSSGSGLGDVEVRLQGIVASLQPAQQYSPALIALERIHGAAGAAGPAPPWSIPYSDVLAALPRSLDTAAAFCGLDGAGESGGDACGAGHSAGADGGCREGLRLLDEALQEAERWVLYQNVTLRLEAADVVLHTACAALGAGHRGSSKVPAPHAQATHAASADSSYMPAAPAMPAGSSIGQARPSSTGELGGNTSAVASPEKAAFHSSRPLGGLLRALRPLPRMSLQLDISSNMLAPFDSKLPHLR